MRGVGPDRTTQAMRERQEERRDVSRRALLFQIREELDPQNFTLAEVRDEFEAQTSEKPGTSRGFIQTVNAEEELSVLVSNGYVERISRGHYRVTELGMNLEQKS